MRSSLTQDLLKAPHGLARRDEATVPQQVVGVHGLGTCELDSLEISASALQVRVGAVHEEQRLAAPKPEAKTSCTTYFNASQDWDKVLRQCEEEGRAGGVTAQQILGLMFEKGLGTPVNRVMAADWYRRAAEAGNAKAQYYYGRLLNEGGDNVRRDREQAVSWFTKAATAGEAEAMSALGRALMKGEGTNRNKTEGLRWYEQAAAQGVAEAQYQLALLYKNGDTVVKSESLALEWMEKAAKRGHPKAQAEVGKLRDAAARKQGP